MQLQSKVAKINISIKTTTCGSIYDTDISNFKAGYMATLVACGWAGAVLEKVTRASGQEPYAQKGQKRQKSKKGSNRPTDQQTYQTTNRPTKWAKKRAWMVDFELF